MQPDKVTINRRVETSVNYSNNKVFIQSGWVNAQSKAGYLRACRMDTKKPHTRMVQRKNIHLCDMDGCENVSDAVQSHLCRVSELNGNVLSNTRALERQNKRRGVLSRQKAIINSETYTQHHSKERSRCQREELSHSNDTVSDDSNAFSSTSTSSSDASGSQCHSVESDTHSTTSSSTGAKCPAITKQRTFRIDSVDGVETLLLSNLSHDTLELKHKMKRHSNPVEMRARSHRTDKRHSQPSNKLEDTRLVVLGSGGVGKSSLVAQFINGFFPANYQPTVEDSHRHLVQLPDGVFQTIEILDTAGFHQFPAMRMLSIQSGDAFVVVYSVDNSESFQEALELVDLIKNIKTKYRNVECLASCPIMLVGNKADLESARKVTTEDAKREASERRCYFVEATAKDNANVQKMFSELLVTIFGVDRILRDLDSRKQSRFRRLTQRINGISRKSIDRMDSNSVNNTCGDTLCSIL